MGNDQMARAVDPFRRWPLEPKTPAQIRKYLYYLKNRERINAASRAFYHANKAYFYNKLKEWREANPAMVARQSRAAYERHRLKNVAYSKARWDAKRALLNQQAREFYQANKEIVLKRRRFLKMQRASHAQG